MAINILDVLSPKITFFFYNNIQHSSKISKLLSIILLIIYILYIISIFLDFFYNNFPIFHLYRKHINNPELLPIEINNIYHHFQLINIENQTKQNFDPKFMRIFLFNSNTTILNNSSLLSDIDHWTYSKCDNNITNGICIKYYYNSTSKNYFSLDDKENFKYPKISYNNNSKPILTAIMEKCRNDSMSKIIYGNCADENETNNYLNSFNSITLNYLDNQVDFELKDFQKESFYDQITTGVIPNIKIINEIYYSPLLIKIKKYFFFGKVNETISLKYEKNRQIAINNNSKNLLFIYNFYVNNNAFIFENKNISFILYIIPKIGGFIHFIYIIFYLINLIFNRLELIQDSIDLIFNWNEFNKNKSKKEKKKYYKILKELKKNDAVKFKDIIDNNISVKDQKSEIKNKKQKFYSPNILNTQTNFPLGQNIKSKQYVCNFSNSFKQNNIGKKIPSMKDNFFSNFSMRKDKSNINNSIINADANMSYSRIGLSHDKEIPAPLNQNFDNNSSKVQSPNFNKNISVPSIKLDHSIDKKGKTNSNIFVINKTSNNRGSGDGLISKKKNGTLLHQLKSSDKHFLKYLNSVVEIYKKNNAFKINHINNKYYRNKTKYLDYFSSFFGNKEANNSFYLVSKFRKKILSEEHMFKISMLLLLLERFDLKDKMNLIDLYESL